MKNGLTFKILIFLFTIGFIGLLFSTTVKGDNGIIYVDDDADPSWYNETNVQTIQEGINNASTGDTIFVYNGTYNEDLFINKTINLYGESNVFTIINGEIYYEIVNGGNISNFNITYLGGNSSSEIILMFTNNINISNNTIFNGSGIFLDCYSDNNTIYNNLIKNNYYGVYLSDACEEGSSSCENNTINNNIIIKNFNGLIIDSSTNNLIFNNYFNNTFNVNDTGINRYNISKTLGTNIIGGPYLGGNFWNDYDGADENGDGLGDTPYYLFGSGNNTDYYPLVYVIVNTPPVAVDDNVSVLEDSSNNQFDVLSNDFDIDNDSLSIAGIIQPSHGMASFTTSYVYYTPDANYSGPDQFSYSISDGNNGTDTATVFVTVDGVNDPPVAVDDSYNVSENSSLLVDVELGVLGNDFDDDLDNLTVDEPVSETSNGTLVLSDNGSFLYTPDPGFYGIDFFEYRAYDGTNYSNIATVTINVTINDTQPPTKVTGLTVKDEKDGKLDLSWNSSTDNIGIAYYRIYCDKKPVINTTDNSTSYIYTGLTNGIIYTFNVSAVDEAGNEGEQSESKSGTPTKSSTSVSGGYTEIDENQKPVAIISDIENYGFIYESIKFDGSKSYDDGEIVSYHWDFDDGVTATGNITSHTYLKTGVYNVTLTVTDDDNAIDTAKITMVISTGNHPPSKPTLKGFSTGNKFKSYEFTAVSFDLDNDSIQYVFDWGDGNKSTTKFYQSGESVIQAHNWSKHGVYQITVTAYDNLTLSEINKSMILIDIYPINDTIIGYLIDQDSDGFYDIFENLDNGLKTNVKHLGNQRYLLNIDDEGDWDYKIGDDFEITKYEEDDNKITTFAIISVAFGAVVVFFYVMITETGKYKFFALLALALGPIFTRIKKDEALDQFQRGRIYSYIEQNPGSHYNKIMKNIGVGNGTLSHHLNMLEKMEMIKSRREGFMYRAFYTTGVNFPESEEYRFTELQHKIIKMIKNKDNISQKEIATTLGKKQQTINYNIKTLERNGMIKLTRKNGKTYCSINKENN